MADPNKQRFKNPLRRVAQSLVNMHRRLLNISPKHWHLVFWCGLSAALIVMLATLAFLRVREVEAIALVNVGLFAGLAVAIVTARWNRYWLLFIAATSILVGVLVAQRFDVGFYVGALAFSPLAGAFSLTLKRRWLRMFVATIALAPVCVLVLFIATGNNYPRYAYNWTVSNWAVVGIVTFTWTIPWVLAYYVPEGAFPSVTSRTETKYPKVMWGLALLMIGSVLVAALQKPPYPITLGTVARSAFSRSRLVGRVDRCFAMADAAYSVCERRGNGHRLASGSRSIVLRHDERDVWDSGQSPLAIQRAVYVSSRTELAALSVDHGEPRLVDVLDNRVYVEAAAGDVTKVIALDFDISDEGVTPTVTELGSYPSGETCRPVAAARFLCVDNRRLTRQANARFEVYLRTLTSRSADASEPIGISGIPSVWRARLLEAPSGAWLHLETDGGVASLPVALSAGGLRHRRTFWAGRLSALGTDGLLVVVMTLLLLTLLVSRLIGHLRLKKRIARMLAGTLSQSTLVGVDGVAVAIVCPPGVSVPTHAAAEAQPVVIEVSSSSDRAMPFRANDTVAVRTVHWGDKQSVSAALQAKHNQRTLMISAITFVLMLASLAWMLVDVPIFES